MIADGNRIGVAVSGGKGSLCLLHLLDWRRTLFQVFREMGCNVVAFGHHADDLAQTTLLNLLFGGRVETMSLRRDYFEGKLRLI